MKRGGYLKRRTELRRGPGPKARKPIRQYNPERRRRRKAKGEVYGPGYARIAGLPTCIGQRSRTEHVCRYYEDRRPEADHLKTVGSGGKDERNLLDVCHAMHDLRHDIGPKRLAKLLDMDLQAEAARVWEAP